VLQLHAGILSAAVVDMRNSWTQRLIGLCAPSSGSGHVTPIVLPQSRFGRAPRLRALRAGPWCDHGLLSFVNRHSHNRRCRYCCHATDIPAGCNLPLDSAGWTRRMRVRGVRRAKVSFLEDAGS
jgi:hypothetical protein